MSFIVQFPRFSSDLQCMLHGRNFRININMIISVKFRQKLVRWSIVNQVSARIVTNIANKNKRSCIISYILKLFSSKIVKNRHQFVGKNCWIFEVGDVQRTLRRSAFRGFQIGFKWRKGMTHANMIDLVKSFPTRKTKSFFQRVCWIIFFKDC